MGKAWGGGLRQAADAIKVDCTAEHCCGRAGHPCNNKQGVAMRSFHSARIDAAIETKQAQAAQQAKMKGGAT